jgi:TolA-binding protein
MEWFSVLRKTKGFMLAGTLAILALQGSTALAQVVDPSQVPDASSSGGQRQREVEDPWTLQQKRELVKKQNAQRQQDIKKDTDQLLELATELKQYVDKTNENIISLDVIKKAEQIEKLAHAVKDKMKGGN